MDCKQDILRFPPDKTKSGLNQGHLSPSVQMNIGLLFGKPYSIIALNKSYATAGNGKQLGQTFSRVNSH